MVLGVLLWVVFGYYWHLVMQQPVTDQTRHALIAVGAIVGSIALFDVFWVFHNRRIAKRSRRRARPTQLDQPRRDFLGRTFMSQNDEDLRRAHYIEVHVLQMEDDEHESGHKLFRVTDRVPEAE